MCLPVLLLPGALSLTTLSLSTTTQLILRDGNIIAHPVKTA
jgi:hypothetical protein